MVPTLVDSRRWIWRHAAGLVGAIALGLAWCNRFTQDDAYISFRFARNLGLGHGLVWNPGEPAVEGYTNFLWTVALAPVFRLGMAPERAAHVFSLVSLAVTLGLSYRLAWWQWGKREAAQLTLLLLASNYSFILSASGGLETQFGIAWIMTAVWSLHRGRLCLGALASACALMTRMDAALLLLPFWVCQIYRSSVELRCWRAAGAVLPGVLMLGAWLFWRHAYYGEWVPNTFFIKRGNIGPTPLRGVLYVAMFHVIYGAWFVLPLTFRHWLRLPANALMSCMVAAWSLWLVYLVWIGGDFMEFRMMAVALPFVAIILGGVLHRHEPLWQRWALLALLLASSAAWAVVQPRTPGIETRRDMVAFAAKCGTAAEALNEALGDGRRSIRIGVSPAGVIPFRTEMPALDLLGLCDAEVARSGEVIAPHHPLLGNRPGHVRMASWDMVRARGVHLLLNQPWLVARRELEGIDWTAKTFVRHWVAGETRDPRSIDLLRVRFPAGDEPVPPVVAWPAPGERFLLTIYLTPHSVVDEAIIRTGAKVIR